MAQYKCEECDQAFYDGDPHLYERNNVGEFVCDCGGIIREVDEDDEFYDPFADGDPFGDMGGPNGLHEDEEGNLTYD